MTGNVSEAQYEQLRQENAYLREQLALLRKALFAARSERHPLCEKDPQAIDLFDNSPVSENAAEAVTTEDILYTRKKRSAGQNRTALPEHLERRVEIIELPEQERLCPECGKSLREIGEDVTEELEIIPMQVFVRRIVRKKYACPSETLHGVFRARMPARVIPKGIAGPGLLSYILISKYVDHLPLDRQEKIFLRYGIKVPKSSMSDWMGRVRHLLDPLLRQLKNRMLDSCIVNCDETTLQVQDNARGGPKRNGYLWSYIGDSRWVWFEWREGRGAQGPMETLRGFTGEYLQSDGYAAYVGVTQALGVDHVGCWAHARRRFFKALGADQDAANAMEVMQSIYRVEREAREQGLDADRRRDLRQQEAKPLLEAMRPWLEGIRPRHLPKSPMGDAINYTLRQWDTLVRYLDDGRLEIDNNRVERQMRSVAVGRKNWMFAGSAGGARRAATAYSLVCTCGLLGIEPWAYLRDVLQRIAEGGDPASLTPRLWKAARSAD